MPSNQKFLIVIALTVISLSLGCSADSQTSAVKTFTPVAETIPINTSSATVTLTNTATVAIPTPTIEESKAIALNLLKNNGDCRLPCMWGLTPGMTTTLQRQNILASYGKFSEPDFSMSGSDASKNPGGFGVRVTKDNVRISVGLSYYEADHLIEILTLVTTPQRENKYVFGDSNYLNLLDYYTLPQLLSNYGLPSDVLVIAFPYDPFLKADYEPFSLVIIYSDLGIMAEYIAPTEWIGKMVELPTPGLQVGEIARGCPNQSYLSLITWNINKNIPIKEIASVAAGEGINANAYDSFLPIEKATSMSIEDFYNKFKEPNNNQCIEVPFDAWSR